MIDENGRRNKFILVVVKEYDLGRDPTSKEFIEYTATTHSFSLLLKFKEDNGGEKMMVVMVVLFALWGYEDDVI